MQKLRKILSMILVITLITIWFFLPSPDFYFPYMYCLAFFLLIAALIVYPVESTPARPKA